MSESPPSPRSRTEVTDPPGSRGPVPHRREADAPRARIEAVAGPADPGRRRLAVAGLAFAGAGLGGCTTVPVPGPLPPMSPRVRPPAPGAAAPAPATPAASAAARAAPPPADWLVLVRGEHRAIDAAFQRLLGVAGPSMRLRALGALADVIGRHALQEETVLYPALVRGGFTAEPQQFYADHAQVKVLLGELEVMPPESTDWEPRVRTLRRLVAQHVVDEETGLYPKFRDALSPEQNAWLAARYQAAGAKYVPG